ncbi:hypothetical protein [Azospirillum picis]|uniref:Uncharacterized protein n=1 Tax=Azospirillum picis TaxID=488438 RepID=A0ABU0MPT3_9PROT|nr:hypothetical protein [Azospirillum picis]MBP2301584.1 hypothetical protein [Azospirillum picis]MDQ0535416.1 hypothetical protein [Azospirillum picis]
MTVTDILKGGQLAGRRKLVMGIVAAVGLVGAYLVGDASLIDAAQQMLPVLIGQ